MITVSGQKNRQLRLPPQRHRILVAAKRVDDRYLTPPGRIIQAVDFRARVGRRIADNLFEERYRVAVAEPAAKIGLQTPPMRREIGSDHAPVVGELAGEPLDFPSEVPCARTTASP